MIITSLFKKINRVDILPGDLFEITSQRLKTKKFRYFLTVLGMGIGVGAVYFLVSLTFGIQQLVIGDLVSSDSLLTLEISPNSEVKNLIALDSAAVSKIGNMEQVTEISPVKSTSAEISYNELRGQAVVYGVDSSYFRLSAIKPNRGRVLTDKDASKIIVSSAVLSLFDLESANAEGVNVKLSLITANEAQNTASTLTQDVTLAGEPQEQAIEKEDTDLFIKTVQLPSQFEIVGIIEDTLSYAYILRNNFDVLELSTYQSAKIKVVAEEAIDPVRNEVISMGYFATAMIDTLNQINQIFRATQITFTIIGIVALLIAAIGMLNTMTVSLLERTREIGIMKAIGASEWGIREMFLAESMLMGLGGGLAGLGVGLLLTQIIGILISTLSSSLGGQAIDIFYTPFWFIVLIVVFSLIIGLLTGLFPARRAARINPLDALRYE